MAIELKEWMNEFYKQHRSFMFSALDEPLKKKKRNSATTEKPMTEIISSDRSLSTNDKKAGCSVISHLLYFVRN